MPLVDDAAMVRAVAARLVGPEEADDVVQETFLRALASPPSADEPIAPWLATVARHVAIDWLRKRLPTVPLDELGATDPPPPRAGGLARLLAGLGPLSEGEVVVLLLRDALDLSVEEVADAVDSSPGSVRVLHHRARRKAAVADRADDAGFAALERFLTWLLARATAGVPVRARPGAGPDPGLSAGTLAAHAALLEGMVEAAVASGRPDLEGRARLARGTARVHTSPADALPDFLAAATSCPEPAVARLRAASVLFHLGRRDEARAQAELGLAKGSKRVRGLLHQFLARLCLDADDREGARAHVEAARAATGSTNVAAAAIAAGVVHLAEERFGEARVEFLTCLAILRSRGNVHDEPALLNNVAIASVGLGDLDEAEALARSALGLATGRGDLRREAQCRGTLATIALRRSRFAEAVAGFERTLDACRAAGLVAEAQLARAFLGVLEHLRGRPDRAAEQLRALLVELDAGGTGSTTRMARAWLLAAEAALGSPAPDAFAALRSEAEAAKERGLAASIALLERLGDSVPPGGPRPSSNGAVGAGVPAGPGATPEHVAALLLRR